MSIEALPPTMILANERSLPHRKVANFYSQLKLKDLERERHGLLVVLTGEYAVAKRISELEYGVLRAQQDDDSPTDHKELFSHLSTSNGRKLLDFCLTMQLSYNQAQGLVQERALRILREQIVEHPETKSFLVNTGALVAIVKAIRDFPLRNQLQRDATALLVSLVFVHNCSDIIDVEGNSIHVSTTPGEGLDVGILNLIQELGGFQLMLEAVEQNRYEVSFFDARAGEVESYARRMARSQIPDVVRRIQSLLRRDDVALLQRKVRFLRTSFARLLNDGTL